MSGPDAVRALRDRLELCREQYSPKMLLKISAGLWPQIDAALEYISALEERLGVHKDALPCECDELYWPRHGAVPKDR